MKTLEESKSFDKSSEDKPKEEKQRVKKNVDLIYDLESLLNKKISVKFMGGKTIYGVLESYDKVPNLILKKEGNFVYCKGSSIISIEK